MGRTKRRRGRAAVAPRRPALSCVIVHFRRADAFRSVPLQLGRARRHAVLSSASVVTGISREHLPRTVLAWMELIDDFGPGDYIDAVTRCDDVRMCNPPPPPRPPYTRARTHARVPHL